MAAAQAVPVGMARHNPLAVTYPSPMILVHYPLFATNVRVLCDKDPARVRGQASLAATINSMRLTYQLEGAEGLYRGVHLYLLHQAAREALRFLADRLIGLLERREQRKAGGELAAVPASSSRSNYRVRLVTKYVIDALCYPVLFASTRAIILQGDGQTTLQRASVWCREEGALCLFSGLAASLLSTALDELMDAIMGACIDRCAAGTDIELADKLLLRASGTSVTSIFTAPINYVGVIQRCQSRIPGLLKPTPVLDTVRNLPLRGSAVQFMLFGGIFALNVRLVQWKLQLQADEAREAEEADEYGDGSE